MIDITYEDKRALAFLDSSYIIALPTETVYGLAIRWDSQVAYDRLVKAKRRAPSKAIAIMFKKDFPFEDYFYIDAGMKRVMDKFLPGPLTVLAKAKVELPYQTHLGTGIVGIRVPGEEKLLAFLASMPFPLQVTSANISTYPALGKYEDVKEVFKDEENIKAIIKGECKSSIPTTVVSFIGGTVNVLREGEISKKMIEKVYFNKEN